VSLSRQARRSPARRHPGGRSAPPGSAHISIAQTHNRNKQETFIAHLHVRALRTSVSVNLFCLKIRVCQESP
jgi:hypothetical protein